jgi:hypothetical protein
MRERRECPNAEPYKTQAVEPQVEPVHPVRCPVAAVEADLFERE